ncbi:DUF948 domain-containing protein [Bacillus taeanensis]|nr:DUF948 domain-containing protein [Bacillus taeanensis]
MEWILYGSIALIVLAIVFLAVKAVQVLKETKPTLEKLQSTSNNIQAQIDDVNKETTELQQRTTTLSEDVNQKKAAVQFTITSAKEIGESLKEIKSEVQMKLPINQNERA